MVAQLQVVRRQKAAQLLLDEGFNVAGNFLVEKSMANLIDEFGRHLRTHIGMVQTLLQLGEKVSIDASLEAEQLRNAQEHAAGLGKSLFDLGEEGFEYHDEPQCVAIWRRDSSSCCETLQ